MPLVVFAVAYDDQTKQYYNSDLEKLVDTIDEATLFNNPPSQAVGAICRTIHLRYVPTDRPHSVQALTVKIIANGLYTPREFKGAPR